MKNTDLRVGNLVSLSGSLTLKVYEIHEDCFYAKDAKGSSFKNTWADLKPIPLTEEVMLKLKFKCVKQSEGNYLSLVINSNGDYLANNPYGFFFVLNNEDNFEDEYLPELSIKLDIQHLHQLQNLYHALTGQELKIEL